ncbi:IGR protein motif-domain-containing protein [Aspergillus coremiiformis]|uniref:Small ribosomal subunit protein mS41 n=1 Tax=Aspergillus coremiiformis TaxID=138285 RepID=A0A5N6YVA4_9EURO|nr:IGR protein motif-domain-containing protein [Aspergillus coremiiformis]
MAMRSSSILSLRLTRPLTISKYCVQFFHKRAATPSVPPPTPFVPDVRTFLTLIGRGMSEYESKLPSWEELFTVSSSELRDLGIQPARQRRYLLRKREQFRKGDFGPGGDLEHVVDGVSQLRVVEVPVVPKDSAKGDQTSSSFNSSATLSPKMKKVIVNLPPDATEYTHDPSKSLRKFARMKIHRGSLISGPYLKPIKGTGNTAALIKVRDGMWGDKLGYKVDGGERRRAEVRAKQRREEKNSMDQNGGR